MEDQVIKEASKGNYITGIIGSIIGGAIAAIPWVFVYVKCNMILSVLAILIALGALKGYEIFKGKVTKALKPIVIIAPNKAILILTFLFSFIISCLFFFFFLLAISLTFLYL